MQEQNEERFDQRNAESRPSTSTAPPPGPGTGLIMIILLLACAVVVSLGYTFSERKQAQDLAAKQEQTSNELQQSLDALAALRAKVDSMSVPVAAPPAPAQPRPSPEAAAATPTATATAKPHVRRKPRVVEDPRWAELRKQLSDQGQQLQSTRQDLQAARQELSDNLASTRDDLNGSIAKTHDELVALEKKGERDYSEFDVTKTRTFARVGSVGLELKKTNTRHDFYDVTLLVDDYKLDKKHVNLYEPVWIYPADSRQALELVVNQISKDEIRGYLSAPRYPEGRQRAQATASAATGAPGSSPTAGSAATPSPAATAAAPASQPSSSQPGTSKEERAPAPVNPRL
jgi:hypothetical protein